MCEEYEFEWLSKKYTAYMIDSAAYVEDGTYMTEKMLLEHPRYDKDANIFTQRFQMIA